MTEPQSAQAQPLKDDDLAAIERIKEGNARLMKEIAKVIYGQIDLVQKLLITMFADGHCLIVGVPGLAKTLLVKTLAQALSWDFKRIQFTPDLMPSDITGTEILQQDQTTGERVLRFVKGPIFANIILADEINRTPPKTQAALLEAMQEYAVTAAGKTMPLEKPFHVIATQNPIEQEGTYPLPEAQLDRFMFCLYISYPGQNIEEQIVEKTTTEEVHKIAPIFSKEDVIDFQRIVRRVPVSKHVIRFAVDMARRTRPGEIDAPQFVNEFVEWGAGPRASQYLILSAKAWAVLQGKPAPSVRDVRDMAAPVLRHRILPNYNAAGEGITSLDIIDRLLTEVNQPLYGASAAE
ncbi:MAG: MoxR family ATPase [Planctomycetes bacterium]|nr:MoxR family ATPase [Planctomycetota bacterium]